MGSKEEVVVVTEDGHGHIPGQIQEGLQGARERKLSRGSDYYTYRGSVWLDLQISVNELDQHVGE